MWTLVVDGTTYQRRVPSSEDELQSLVDLYYRHIFPEEILYYPVKRKLTTLGGVGSIPDGYAISLLHPRRWFIVEVELSSHDVFNHIVPQVSKFAQGIRDPESRKTITRALYNAITNDPRTVAHVKDRIGEDEIYHFLSETIDKPPVLTVVIDQVTEKLRDACNSIPILDKRVVEFGIFESADSDKRKAFLLTSDKGTQTSGRSSRDGSRLRRARPIPKSEYEIPILESLIEAGGSGRTRDVLAKVYEKMKPRFGEIDLEKLASGRAVRWRNRAMWTRKGLALSGYLKENSARGLWEISNKGRKYYERKKNRFRST